MEFVTSYNILSKDDLSVLQMPSHKTILMKLVTLTNKYPALNKVIEDYIRLFPDEVNIITRDWPAIFYAVEKFRRSSIKTIQILLKNGAHVNIRFWRILGIAIENKYCTDIWILELVKILLLHGAIIDCDLLGIVIHRNMIYVSKLLAEYDAHLIPPVKTLGKFLDNIKLLNMKN